jgi:hypothetical protein
MKVLKEIKDKELYLYVDGELIYKRWLETGQYVVLNDMIYNKYSFTRDLIYEYRDRLIIVKARLKMKTTEEGGRKHGFISGYRPNHVFEYEDSGVLRTYIGDIIFDGKSTIEPGEETDVTVRFTSLSSIEKYLNIGRKWWIHEANRCLGEAEMIDILSWNV